MKQLILSGLACGLVVFGAGGSSVAAKTTRPASNHSLTLPVGKPPSTRPATRITPCPPDDTGNSLLLHTLQLDSDPEEEAPLVDFTPQLC
ncbi:MAG TPA: hypothetical protein VGK19_13390 [Capsulimonadaceae bacterium]|jgi:hypothetical protein